MRSRGLSALALMLCAGLMTAPMSPSLAAEPVAQAPTRAQVHTEVDRLRADPDLSSSRQQHTLRLKPQEEKKRDDTDFTALLKWMRDLSRWVSEASRAIVWVLGAALVAVFLVCLRHWIRVRAGGGVGGVRIVLPSHVRDLDIRPESLPDDVGAFAAALWQRGEHRAALSLLYRGALSRLVHAHAVPIRAASTEGECLALAAQRLPPQPSAYFGRLVQAWQLAVYGARMPASDRVLALCRDFDGELSLAPPSTAEAPA